MNKIRYFVIPALSFVLFSVLLVPADKLLGKYLNSAGYFKATDPLVRQIYNTNEFQTDIVITSQGIRDIHIAIPKPKSSYRILTLGDSMTLGWGVKPADSWPKILEKKLQQDNSNIEIINAAVPGADPYTGIQICQAYASFFQVDAIILGFYSTDDLYQTASRFYESDKSSIRKVLTALFPTFSRVSHPVIFNIFANTPYSPSSTFIMSNYWKEYAGKLISRKPSILGIIDPAIKNAFLEGKINPSLIEYAADDPYYLVNLLDENNMQDSLYALDNDFSLLKKNCSGNLPVFVVFLPSEELVSRYFFPYRQGLGFQVSGKLLSFNPDVQIASVAGRYGFGFISLLPALRNDNCTRCYFPWDNHFTPYGNQKVAAFIYPVISSYLAQARN